jgi:hypothetical protein
LSTIKVSIFGFTIPAVYITIRKHKSKLIKSNKGRPDEQDLGPHGLLLCNDDDNCLPVDTE